MATNQVENQTGSATIKSLEVADSTPEGRYKHWLEEVNVAEKNLEKWIERGRKIDKRYVDDRDALASVDKRFNIFTNNVEILQSALYAQVPRVEVERRFGDMNDDVARVAANIVQRMIKVDLDRENNDFDSTMKNSVQDRLVPGAGFAWLRYEPKIETISIEDPATGEVISIQEVKDHYVDIDYVYWEDFLYSPCRVWEERRWVGRRVFMDYDSLVHRFGKEKADKIPLDYNPRPRTDTDSLKAEHQALKKATIYEVWDRTSKKVLWLSKGFGELIDERDDPLKLENFEPCPRPLFARTSTSNYLPVADFYILQDQYNELDTVNNRISLLVAACKVVGVYDRSADGVQRMLIDGTDNTLIPVDNWAMFAEKGGIKGQVDWLPLETIIVTLEKLQMAAERLKQQIYELSGISDIMRGSSNPYEGVGSQEIKAQFASARLQRMQNEIARFAGDTLNLKAEIMLRHFPIEFMIKKSNIMNTFDAQLVMAAVPLLQNEEEFGWRVKIVPDSMAQIDYAQEKAQRTEFISAIAGFLNNAMPAMTTAPQLLPFMATLLKFGIAGYKNSQGLETILDKYIDDIQKQMDEQKKQPPKPSPEEQKAQAEMAKMQQEAQLKQQEQQTTLQVKQMEAQLDMQIQRARADQEMQIVRERAALDAQLKREQAALDAEVKKAQADLALAIKQYQMMNQPEKEEGKEETS